MIAFGVAIASREKFDRWARPGIARVAEPDSLVLTRSGFDSIQEPYNELLDEAAERSDLEALVLLHEDAEIVDPDFCAKVRRALARPEVGMVGPIGGRGVDSIAWWEGATFGRIDAPNVMVGRLCRGDFDIGSFEVEALDGLMLIVSPSIVRSVRFDERFKHVFHGYDVDFSFQVRACGKTCVVAPLDVIHYGDWKSEQNERWADAAELWERKWAARRDSGRRSWPAWA